MPGKAWNDAMAALRDLDDAEAVHAVKAVLQTNKSEVAKATDGP